MSFQIKLLLTPATTLVEQNDSVTQALPPSEVNHKEKERQSALVRSHSELGELWETGATGNLIKVCF